MKIDVLSIFPGYLAPLRESLIGKAVDRGVIELGVHDLRRWTYDVHRTVDDSPYGGGPGMLMRAEPWGLALDELAPVDGPQPRLVVPTPAGRPFTQALANELAAEPWLLFACGRYEGIDARVVEYAADRMVVDEVSLGDYVLAGGEVAVLVMVEAIGRLLPGVLGNVASHEQDSFSDGLLEGPAYTRPEVWRGRPVPDVLLSGHHAAIARWRRDEALRRTAARRPDLLSAVTLDTTDRKVLAEFGFSAPSRTASSAPPGEGGFPVPDQDVAQ
ncbi:tRNA (guanosine(37)-N1)-methyltransferase TrmD [Cryptosporangium minutisporangium]|uniref:tRNA (guanine-N(1)-)-methyltransferase n=1 Tax=Cryptosporangium minutisporangium TaxID=113569 RepID=A0ABP6T467_9ACTN